MSNLFSFLVFLIIIIMISNSCSEVAEGVLDPRDYLALQSIRSSLHDLPGSSFFSTWDFTAYPCSTFSGLLCSADRVISLSLGSPLAGSPGLSGHLPSSISSLTALTHLSLVPGRVSGPIPSQLSHCTNLRFLALSHNYLSGPIPHPVTTLPYLHTLDLSFNLLSGQLPLSFSPSLSNLILAHNRLSGELTTSSLPNSLARLDLKQNSLSGPLLSPLPRTLIYLSLSSNHLSGAITSRVMGRLSQLHFLDLSRNEFSGEIPGEIFSFPVVSEIRLQKNRFSGSVKVVGRVSSARTVDLSYNNLGGSVPEGLADAERIYLNSNRFVGRVPGRYGERMREGRIEVLYLQRNYLVGMDGVDANGVDGRVTLCLNYNCMTPPRGNVCPVRNGRWKRRPERECKLVRSKKPRNNFVG